VARHGLSRPEGVPHLQDPIPHHRWSRHLITGSLRLSLQTPAGQFVSPATGRLTLTSKGSEELIAQEAARIQGVPVIPGSGIKGAVRNLYELLSFSCDPLGENRCKSQLFCDACTLFGALGRGGQVGFTDARPAGPEAVRVEVQEVPIPWPPQKPEGDVSLYDFQEAKQFDRDRKVFVTQPKELSREVFSGRFETRMTFWNATREELGRLLLSMGIGAGDTTKFLLRLGGVKYDGKGAVEVQPRALTLVAGASRKTYDERAGRQECSDWIEAAKTAPWAATFWPKLEEVANLLRGSS
jgi:hypothetical protein